MLRLEVGESDDAAQGANIAPFSLCPRDHEVAYLPGAFLQYLSKGTFVEETVEEEEASTTPEAHRLRQLKADTQMVKVAPLFA